MPNRKERRAAERHARKLASQAARLENSNSAAVAAAAPAPASAPLADIPEPGRPFPLLAEISPARLAANQANAQLSTGPKTPEGLAISSQNRTTHGLARHNGNFRILVTENAAAFDALKLALVNEHQPATETEALLVSDMAESRWLRERAQALQAACFSDETGAIADPKTFALYLRYETTHNNNFYRSLNQLLKLRSERRKAELGFEAQRIQTEKHQMKKDTHYWDVMRKDAEACHQMGQNVLLKIEGTEKNSAFPQMFQAELASLGLQKGAMNTAIAA